MLSIIIPALNEERYLPILLKSIKRQEVKEDKSSSSPSFSLRENSVFQDRYEIIVADANSTDKTVAIAKSFSCNIVKGGLPAKGRNEGAKVAQGDLFLFLDADLKIPDGFLKKSLKEFKERNLDVASYCLVPRTGRKIFKIAFNIFYNRPIVFCQKFLAHGSSAILVKKNIFEQVGGFDESVKLAEDYYFVKQAFKIGKFGIIKSTNVYIVLRRFETDGWLPALSKHFLCYLYMFSGKSPQSKFFDYKFNHYKK